MHFDQSLLDQKLQAIRDKMANPQLTSVKEVKQRIKPVVNSAVMLQLQASIAARKAAKDEKSKQLKEAAELKQRDKWEQKREAKANKERRRLRNEQEEKSKLATRVVDYSKMKTLRIDSKTLIYISIDQDPEEARKNWLDKHSRPVEKPADAWPPTYEF